MRVVISSATANEWVKINEVINPLYTGESQRLQVSFHVSGVGILPSTFSLSQLIIQQQPDLVIQAGIAGTFDTRIPLGKVVAVKDEALADTGVEENGKWKDVFDLKLQAQNEPPFEKKKLINPWLEKYNILKLPEVSGVTISQVTTKAERARQIEKKYNPVVESMEGAALHYVCLQTVTPFIQIRGISNYIGERNKANWKIKEALDNVTTNVTKLLDRLYKLK
ncbi:MAG: mqnB [Segetibacter sp.]|nr:mqnB [Segetibacter sp.]